MQICIYCQEHEAQADKIYCCENCEKNHELSISMAYEKQQGRKQKAKLPVHAPTVDMDITHGGVTTCGHMSGGRPDCHSKIPVYSHSPYCWRHDR